MTSYLIRTAQTHELSLLPAIEDVASIRFRELNIPIPEGLEDITIEEYRNFKKVLVAEHIQSHEICGFIAIDEKDNSAYIEEVSVHPNHGRQGIGRALVENAISWAGDTGYSAILLTTYINVPFNGPFYQKMGFRPLPENEMGPEILKTRQQEKECGLDHKPRMAMRLEIKT